MVASGTVNERGGGFLISIRIKVFRIISVRLSFFLSGALSGGFTSYEHSHIYGKYYRSVLFTGWYRTQGWSTEMSFDRQNCLFTYRSDLYLVRKLKCLFSLVWGQKCLFPLKVCSFPFLDLKQTLQESLKVRKGQWYQTNYVLTTPPPLSKG